MVGVKLGCLNHALLTAAAIAADGLTLAGWIATELSADMPYASENIDTLKQRLRAPCLGVVPYQTVVDPAAIAQYLTLP